TSTKLPARVERIAKPIRTPEGMPCQIVRSMTTAGTLPMVLLRKSVIGVNNEIRSGSQPPETIDVMVSCTIPVRANASFTTNNDQNRIKRGKPISPSSCRLETVRLTIRKAATRMAEISRGTEVVKSTRSTNKAKPQMLAWRRSKLVETMTDEPTASPCRVDRQATAMHANAINIAIEAGTMAIKK